MVTSNSSIGKSCGCSCLFGSPDHTLLRTSILCPQPSNSASTTKLASRTLKQFVLHSEFCSYSMYLLTRTCHTGDRSWTASKLRLQNFDLHFLHTLLCTSTLTLPPNIKLHVNPLNFTSTQKNYLLSNSEFCSSYSTYLLARYCHSNCRSWTDHH